MDTGPATVRMVSSNGPPLPMPMQVPPGHMVQQIIDENGILTNVILSSQPPGIMAPPLMVGYYVSILLLALYTVHCNLGQYGDRPKCVKTRIVKPRPQSGNDFNVFNRC